MNEVAEVSDMVVADATDHRKIECSNDGDRPRQSSIQPGIF